MLLASPFPCEPLIPAATSVIRSCRVDKELELAEASALSMAPRNAS